MKHLEYIEKGFIVVKDFIPKPFALYLANYFDLLEENNKLDKELNTEELKTIYGDPAFDTVMAMSCSGLSEIIQVDLLPTYSLGEMYFENYEKLPSVGKDECEHIVSLFLYSENQFKWPIFLQSHNNVITDVELDIGDAVVYMGDNIIQWRNKFLGKKYYQLTMNYVDANGVYGDNLYDKRSNLGLGIDTKTR